MWPAFGQLKRKKERQTMTKETTTTTTTTKTTTTTTTTKTKPQTFLEAVKMFAADDIATGDFKILSLRELGKYGYVQFMITGENEHGPIKNYYYLTYIPGKRFMTGYVQNRIIYAMRNIREDMRPIYGMSNSDCIQDRKNLKNCEFNEVV